MKTIEPYIVELKEKLNLETYSQTMEYLGMAKQAWTAIQKGAGITEKNAIRIGGILKIDPIELMAISMALKAKNKEAQNIWLKLAKEKEAERKKQQLETEQENRH
jgi:hypothetical protein